MNEDMAKSFSDPLPDSDRERVLDRARDPGSPERSAALVAAAQAAEAAAPWIEGYAMPITVSLPRSLIDAVLGFGGLYLSEEKPNPKKSEIVATVLRNGLSLLIEHVTAGEQSPHQEDQE